MTLREHLNRNIGRATICCWIMVPFGIVVVVTQAHGYIGHAALVICLGFYVVAVYYTLSARCPRCRTGLLFNLLTFGIRLWIPPWFNSCPTCGLSFDTQVGSPSGSNQALQPTAGRSDN